MKFHKACLMIIVLLLAVIALRPVINPTPALAKNQYQYAVIAMNAAMNRLGPVQTELDKRTTDGWELVQFSTGEQTTATTFYLVFRKQTH